MPLGVARKAVEFVSLNLRSSKPPAMVPDPTREWRNWQTHRI